MTKATVAETKAAKKPKKKKKKEVRKATARFLFMCAASAKCLWLMLQPF